MKNYRLKAFCKINLSNTHDGSATRKRLQKKLQERNEGKVDVNKKD